MSRFDLQCLNPSKIVSLDLCYMIWAKGRQCDGDIDKIGGKIT